VAALQRRCFKVLTAVNFQLGQPVSRFDTRMARHRIEIEGAFVPEADIPPEVHRTQPASAPRLALGPIDDHELDDHNMMGRPF
jgi:hypothetical protein